MGRTEVLYTLQYDKSTIWGWFSMNNYSLGLLTALCKRDTLYTLAPNHGILAQYSSIDTSPARRLCQTSIIKSMGQSAGAVRPANSITMTHRQPLSHCPRMSYRHAQCGSAPAQSHASAAAAVFSHCS